VGTSRPQDDCGGAQSALTEQTKAKIVGQATLQPGTLAAGAVWPDDIGKNFGEGAEAFNKAFPKNGDWHFVNLPLGVSGYPDLTTLPQNDPLRTFVSENDVVAALNRAITVLETPGANREVLEGARDPLDRAPRRGAIDANSSGQSSARSTARSAFANHYLGSRGIHAR
jgi:hypothetical protein